ncbi:sterol desaturase-like protein [Artemisia annua]|uniref:Sterol desaturase-like protein n=1 Tax=Artemisia annua TaxID=35608 RepID=A0A2U1M4M8_ARTAN|nr:sterol desaturase-like protein [Artemisia annua]
MKMKITYNSCRGHDATTYNARCGGYNYPHMNTFLIRKSKLTMKQMHANDMHFLLLKVAISRESDYEMLKSKLKSADDQDKLVLSRTYSQKQRRANEGVKRNFTYIPYSQFPPKKVRKDCFYYTTPSMLTPKYLENVDSCENWLPRRVMSAWRIAGILHGLEGWNVNEYGNEIFNVDKVWEASLQHGFTPIMKAS